MLFFNVCNTYLGICSNNSGCTPQPIHPHPLVLIDFCHPLLQLFPLLNSNFSLLKPQLIKFQMPHHFNDISGFFCISHFSSAFVNLTSYLQTTITIINSISCLQLTLFIAHLTYYLQTTPFFVSLTYYFWIIPLQNLHIHIYLITLLSHCPFDQLFLTNLLKQLYNTTSLQSKVLYFFP